MSKAVASSGKAKLKRGPKKGSKRSSIKAKRGQAKVKYFPAPENDFETLQIPHFEDSK